MDRRADVPVPAFRDRGGRGDVFVVLLDPAADRVVDPDSLSGKPGALDPLDELKELVLELTMPEGLRTSLLAKLLTAGRPVLEETSNASEVTRNVLEAFINAVEAHSGSRISSQDADSLIALAMEIIESLP